MFSFICALPSPASAGSCLPLFGRFTGSTAQSDFSGACVSVVRLCAFTDRPSSITEGALEISRFSCMLFLSVRGFLDYAGPDSHSCLTRLPCCLPPTRQGVGILIWRFSKLNHPAHRCLGLRFATHLAMCHARLEVRMERKRESNAPVLLRAVVVKCWHERRAGSGAASASQCIGDPADGGRVC